MKGTSWSRGLSVTADGDGVVPLAGAVSVRLLADRVGLTQRLSTALSRRSFSPVHDRGQVWVDVATMLTAGGEAIADIDMLRHQAPLLGPVASAPTVWRSLNEASPAALARVEKARAKVRRHVWSLLSQPPASKVAGIDLGEVVVLDVDATLVTATRRRSRPRRRSRAGSVSTRSACGATTPPSCWRSACGRETPAATMPGTTSRSWAGRSPRSRPSSPAPAGPCRRGRRHPSAVGLADRLRPGPRPPAGVLGRLPDQEQRVDQRDHYDTGAGVDAGDHLDGEIRDGAEVAEVTGLLDLRRWPAGMRVIVRRERPHPGAQLSLLEEADGSRTKPSPRTPAADSWRSWKPGTAPTPASRTGSRPPKTPAWAGSRHGSTPSTRPGSRSSRSPPT